MEAIEDGQRERDSFDGVPRDGATDGRVDGRVLRPFHLEDGDDEQ